MGGQEEARQLKSAVDWQNPYLGLDAFTEADREFFYGRKAAEAELFRMVKRQVLTTCFGASGLGKTSLLRAGLFPALREALLFPIMCRMDFSPSRGSLVEQVKQKIRQEAEEWRVEVEDPKPGESLWELFHRVHFWDAANRLLMPVLVLDQFEEIFTLGAGDERVLPFEQELADLIENRIPASARDRLLGTDQTPSFSFDRQHYRVVFSLREDYLPDLEDLQSLIPSLARNRFRLTPMDGVQAMEAILKPGKEIVTENVALEILRVVCGQKATDRVPEPRTVLDRLRVEPTLLSLFCHELNNRRKAARLNTLTVDLLKDSGEGIVSDFYERCFRGSKPEARAFIEDRLLTGSGFRRAEAVEEAVRLPGVTKTDIDQLVNRRLLRMEARLGIPHVELIHDVLAGVVAQSRDRRRQEEERNRQRKRVLRRFGIAAAAGLLVMAIFAWQAFEAGKAARKAREQAAKESAYREQYRLLSLKFDDLLKKNQSSPVLSKELSDLRARVTNLDVCYKYDLCGYNREKWKATFLLEPKPGTWHVIVLSLTSSGIGAANASKTQWQSRFPNQDFEVLATASQDGQNFRYALVVAQGLEDPRLADRIAGFAKESGMAKDAFKRQKQ